MRKITIILALFCIITFAQQKGSFTDSRDGKKYKTVEIGEQVWMAENLNFNAKGSKCYDNKPANCKKYGRLYKWQIARNACPKGWHLPSNADWDKFYRFANGALHITTDGYLEVEPSWTDGYDKFDFAALLLGGCGSSDGSFNSAGNWGFWWSATEYGASAYPLLVGYDGEYADWVIYDKNDLFSIRCVKR